MTRAMSPRTGKGRKTLSDADLIAIKRDPVAFAPQKVVIKRLLAHIDANRPGDAFVLGFAAAIADLIRTHDRAMLAVTICGDSGLDLSDFEAAGVEDFDMEHLREALTPTAARRRAKKP